MGSKNLEELLIGISETRLDFRANLAGLTQNFGQVRFAKRGQGCKKDQNRSGDLKNIIRAVFFN